MALSNLDDANYIEMTYGSQRLRQALKAAPPGPRLEVLPG